MLISEHSLLLVGRLLMTNTPSICGDANVAALAHPYATGYKVAFYVWYVHDIIIHGLDVDI